MSIDVVDLREFYSRRLGIVARQMINRGIRERWPNAEGQRVLGIGYPTPWAAGMKAMQRSASSRNSPR